MEENKSRNALFAVVLVIIVGGAVTFFVGIDSHNDYFIIIGIGSILVGLLLGSLGNSIYDIRDASVKQLKIIQGIRNRQSSTEQSETNQEEPERSEIFTLDWARVVVKEWPVQVAKFQAFNEGDSLWGRVELKNLSSKKLEYIELEVEFWDYLKREVELEEKLVVRELITLDPNESVWGSPFPLPHLISDAQVNLVGVRYSDGEIVLMPDEVESYTLPIVKTIGPRYYGNEAFFHFISSYLEGRGFDVMPTYYYDSTPTHWNCVFCGSINEQKDNSCASCKRERQIQHFAREEFLRKKFEEESSST